MGKFNLGSKILKGKITNILPLSREMRNTKPHKHNNYFEIIYFSKGKGTLVIDHNIYQLKTPIIFLIRKEQVYHWNVTSYTQVNTLLIKNEFIEKSYDKELKSLLYRLSNLSSVYSKDFKIIEQLLLLLAKENNFTIREGLLKALLGKILETAKPLMGKTKFTNFIFQTYRDLLNKTSELKNSVSHYAKQLNTTPQNLNNICRKSANQSANDILSVSIIDEAKRLLYYTNNTVSQIAFLLDFNDPSHFVKYFKRLTGQTPQVFRKQ